MSTSPQLGQTRPSHDSLTHSYPPEKKARLDSGPDATVPKAKEALTKKERKKRKRGLPEPCSPDDVLWRDVIDLLGKPVVDAALRDGREWDSPLEFREEVELEVSALSSTGTALALAPSPLKPWVVSIPFALPGEVIRARIYRNSSLHSFADLIAVVKSNNALRDMGRVRCKHFGECGGCQYQMLSYETQLDLKRQVIIKAYQHFSDLSSSSVPSIRPTIPSPLQYGYRTKLTPHFEAPPRRHNINDGCSEKPDWLKIGFNRMNVRQVMDIEDCPIATPLLNEALGPIRRSIASKIHNYKKGATVLLRDSLEIPASSSSTDTQSTSPEKHICITDHKATIRERVGNMLFEYPAGSFFQNNNSVLVPLTSYVRDAIFPPDGKAQDSPTHLVDAYCGSGLFAITLSPFFEVVTGIELSADSIRHAKSNAALNKIPESKCTFLCGDASHVFSAVLHFPRDRTVLVIDPPRKGCDELFLRQLVEFRCGMVVYVSCNVHTQARDVGIILKTMDGEAEGAGRYVLESLRGVDLFPQTAHVESVAVLRLV